MKCSDCKHLFSNDTMPAGDFICVNEKSKRFTKRIQNPEGDGCPEGESEWEEIDYEL